VLKWTALYSCIPERKGCPVVSSGPHQQVSLLLGLEVTPSKTHSMATKNHFLMMILQWLPNQRSYGKCQDLRCLEWQSYQGYGGYLNLPFT